jgi:hypothetical protein
MPKPAPFAARGSGRPLPEIALQPPFVIAVVAATTGYGVMSLVMTATPIAMLDCRFVFADAAFVMQWHALGMFAPSFVTWSPDRPVRHRQCPADRCRIAAAVLCDQSLRQAQFLAQFLVGVGASRDRLEFSVCWGDDTADPDYQPNERAKVQALNDFLVFGTVALSSFSSGALLSGYGRSMVQLAGLAVLWLKLRTAQAAHGYAGL